MVNPYVNQILLNNENFNSCLIYECKEGGEGEVVDIGQVDRWLVRQLGKELSELNEMRCFITSNIFKPEPET